MHLATLSISAEMFYTTLQVWFAFGFMRSWFLYTGRPFTNTLNAYQVCLLKKHITVLLDRLVKTSRLGFLLIWSQILPNICRPRFSPGCAGTEKLF